MTKKIFCRIEDPDFIVINDKADLFREISIEKWLPLKKEDNDSEKIPTFILAMNKPLCKGVLWEQLVEKYNEQTIVIVSAFALRKAGVNIHETGSAEHLADNFIKNARQNTISNNIAKQLLKCQHVIIQLDGGGIIHCNKSSNIISICYCPGYLSKEHLNSKKFGTMSGNTTILTTSIVMGMVNSLDKNDSYKGIDDGIQLASILVKIHFESGYADINFDQNEDPLIYSPMPFDRLFREYSKQEKSCDKEIPLVSVQLPNRDINSEKSNRIEVLRDQLNKNNEKGFENILIKIVKEGLETALKKDISKEQGVKIFPKVNRWCPIAKFGDLEAVDRDDIDSLIDIKLLITKYLQTENWKEPLSIAVFGPPGSGKSFAVQEIIKEIKGEKGKRPLEFNLAQFTDISDLTAAFHKTQDEALFNNVPLVFFDEFDASYQGKAYGWLKYFLAPMQDGVFKGKEGSYKVGRAIFIFAGGISKTYEDFYGGTTDNEKEQLKEMKVPDFVSRLRGYLDIKGINPKYNESVSDTIQFRRAILLRSILARKAPHIINDKKARINVNLINAFIKAPYYEHGVRSMEAIIQMSSIENDGFHIASLPTRAQLKMHTDVDGFFKTFLHEECV
jgi:DNA replication protein DnaC